MRPFQKLGWPILVPHQMAMDAQADGPNGPKVSEPPR
jgi:hypothetical protein